MTKVEKIAVVCIISVTIVWSIIKLGEFYFKTYKTNLTSEVSEKPTPSESLYWVDKLIALSISKPEKFSYNGYTWKYRGTEIWVANGVEYISIYDRKDIELSLTDREALYEAFVNWNNGESGKRSSSYKID